MSRIFWEITKCQRLKELFISHGRNPIKCGCEAPALQEIKTQVKRLRNYEEDNIQDETLKCMNQTMVENVTYLKYLKSS